MKLTAKQEAFAKEYVKNGGNGSAAYRHAYNAENMSVDTIKVKASQMLKKDNIRLTVESLQEKAKKVAEKKFEWSVEDRMKMLFDIAVTCSMSQGEQEDGSLKLVNPAAAISAIDQMNKMTGDHAAIKQKTDITSSDDSLKPTVIKLVGVKPSGD